MTFLFEPSPIIYWGKFPIQRNFLKQYTYANFYAISQKERPVCSVFCFVSSCKEANTLCFALQVSVKKPTYHHLMTSFRRSSQMFVDVFIELVLVDWPQQGPIKSVLLVIIGW